MSTYGRWGIGSVTLLLVAVGVLYVRSSRDPDSAQSPRELPTGDAAKVVLACPGRVEGRSEATQVGAAADGVLKEVYAKEGQVVKKGELLAEIACDDLTAGLQTAGAEADSARQARARLLRGTRDEEKRVATEKTAAVQAAFAQAKSRLEMMRGLYQKEEISRADYELTLRESGVAEANLQAAIRTEELLAAPPLPEEIARADADVLAAEGRINTIQERIRKCSVLAPIAGTVLRVYGRSGESYSTLIPRPLFSLVDASGRRVRAEVDEGDISKVHIGQSVVIQADALAGRKLNGSVLTISPAMGRKNVSTGDPLEKSDRDILEVMVGLGNDVQPLPIGLRVTVQFLSGSLLKKSKHR